MEPAGLNFSLLINLIVAVPFIAIGLFFIWLARRSRRQAEVAASWPTVSGKVLTSCIEARQTKIGNTNSIATSYFPVVTYVYQVGGQHYEGHRICPGFDRGSGSPAAAEKLLSSYPVNAAVTVHYNPADPAEAALDPTASSLSPGRIFGWVGGCLIAGTFMMLALSGGLAWFLSQLAWR